MKKADLDKRICDVEPGAENTETYREFLTESFLYLIAEKGDKIPDWDSMTEEELNDSLSFLDELYYK